MTTPRPTLDTPALERLLKDVRGENVENATEAAEAILAELLQADLPGETYQLKAERIAGAINLTALLAQRDRLLAACEALVEWDEAEDSYSTEALDALPGLIDQARAAIAEARA